MREVKLIDQFPREVIALDEVGRSPLSGPVVIGAVRLHAENPKSLERLIRSLRRREVKDSKLLTPQKRQNILQRLGIEGLPFRRPGRVVVCGVELSHITWEMGPEVIDTENILQASLRGMREAAQELSRMKQTLLLIDGHLRINSQNKNWTEVPIVKGDSKSALIGLAAILAKVRRDALMREMHECYPGYGFDHNFGYPTREHREAIASLGPCEIHRRSFGKVKEFL